MPAWIDEVCRLALHTGLRMDLEQARRDYNALGSVLFLGVGIVALLALLLSPEFSYKPLVYAYTAYCFLMPAVYRWRPPGLPLPVAMLQVPLSLGMIISLQLLMPPDLVYLTAFLFPILFVFTFEFHSRAFTGGVFVLALAATAGIVVQRQLPNWQPYLVTTFGSTLIIGLVVHLSARKVQALANSDPLTGLMNRRYWETSVRQSMALCLREMCPLSVIFLDLDGFKQINDSHGHGRGDQVLCQVAHCLDGLSREADSTARWGGDEFVIAMPNTNEDQARALVRRIRRELKDVQISAGVVEWVRGESFESLLWRADQAMYRVKTQPCGEDVPAAV